MRGFDLPKALLRRAKWLRGTARGLTGRAHAFGKAQRTLIVTAVFAAMLSLAFWLGAEYSSPVQKPPTVESLDDEVRKLAQARIAHSQENAELRVQLTLRDAEIEKLAAENRGLIADILRRDETILIYRQIIDATGGDMVIHALAEEPGFGSGQRRLSAVLVRSKSGKFKGAYYFEVVSMHNGGEHTLRVPQEPVKLSFQRYYEIAESVDLPDDARITKMRLIVTDAKNKIIASGEESFVDDGENGGREYDNGEGGGAVE